MSETIIINGDIITVDKNDRCISQGALAFCDGVITYVGNIPEDLSKYDVVIDICGDVLMPGLVNTHGHTPMSLIRGYADDLPLQKWLEEKIWPLEAQFTSQHAKWGARLSILEMLKTGTTSFVDMYKFIDDIAEVVSETGIRGTLCEALFEFGSKEETENNLKAASQFARDYQSMADGRIQTMMCAHSAYTCSPNYIEKIIDEAVKHDVPVHTHMSETAEEVEKNIADFGVGPVKHLNNLGMFELPTLVAHAVHVNDEELDILAEKDVKISHNLISNLKLGSGIAPISKMQAKGLTVALGTDGAASNNNLDLFEELRMTALVHKGYEHNPLSVPAENAIRMATIDGADAIWQGNTIGSLEVGKEADFITIDKQASFFQPQANIVSQIGYGASGRDVKHVFVKGKQVVKNKESLTIDEERVRFEVARLMQGIDIP